MAEEFKNFEDVEKQFWKSMGEFSKQLEKISKDMQAMEIITAIGTTTVKFKSGGQDGSSGDLDITSLANSNDNFTNIVEGNITILARTRFELDGDLLVILPTKPKSVGATTSLVSPSTTGTTTTGTSSSTSPVESYEINAEVLELHKQNVNLALQNLQFVYGKAMEILSKLAESKGSPLDIFRR
jgi:hypothetical protein